MLGRWNSQDRVENTLCYCLFSWQISFKYLCMGSVDLHLYSYLSPHKCLRSVWPHLLSGLTSYVCRRGSKKEENAFLIMLSIISRYLLSTHDKSSITYRFTWLLKKLGDMLLSWEATCPVKYITKCIKENECWGIIKGISQNHVLYLAPSKLWWKRYHLCPQKFESPVWRDNYLSHYITV